MTMNVQLISNRLLRILQNHQANCEKMNDDLENVNYLCTVLEDISKVDSIKIDSNFNFKYQDVLIVGISPVAHAFMENVQNATGEFDKALLQSYIYILDHSIIYTNKKNYAFNITGIIDDQKFNFSNIDLTLKINVENKDEMESDANCSFFNINGSNYSLNCIGEKNILYDFQSAISFFENDILIINFDENTTSKILFNSSNSYRYRKIDTSGLSAGVIVAFVLILLIVLIIAVILIKLRKKLFQKKSSNYQESSIVNLKTI